MQLEEEKSNSTKSAEPSVLYIQLLNKVHACCCHTCQSYRIFGEYTGKEGCILVYQKNPGISVVF